MNINNFDIVFKNNKTTIQIPTLCPNCGVANNPTAVSTGQTINLLKENGFIHTFIHRCPVCQEFHVTIQQEFSNSKAFKCLMHYPNSVAPNIDPVLIKNAPSFVKFYSEAIEAENNGLFNLAGIGMRAAIECLIKDYALAFNIDTEENISKQSFNNVIDKYIKDDELLRGSIHIVRKIGNDFTHWHSVYDMPYTELKSYVDIVIAVFTSKFKMKFLPI